MFKALKIPITSETRVSSSWDKALSCFFFSSKKPLSEIFPNNGMAWAVVSSHLSTIWKNACIAERLSFSCVSFSVKSGILFGPRPRSGNADLTAIGYSLHNWTNYYPLLDADQALSVFLPIWRKGWGQTGSDRC